MANVFGQKTWCVGITFELRIGKVLVADDSYPDCCRQVANGEILGTSLMLEDVLQTGEFSFSLIDEPKAVKAPPTPTDADGSLLEESTPHLALKNCKNFI